MNKLLYENIETYFDVVERPTISDAIIKNIKQPLRDYQVKALENFIFYNTNKKYKDIPNKHLLFHMATGSGKTNIIASSILYLYELGYRDFIFFVNTNNIITKTKENLLNSQSSKYLFKNKIIINNKEVKINVIDDTFNASKKDAINILFTTINQLHGDLETIPKENSISYNDFKERKIVLLADEAHHLNASTKTEKLTEKDWETTTQNLLKSNEKNLLLEFTATQDLADKKIGNKYIDKIIYDYPLKKFRDEGYSKDIKLISDNFDDEKRMLQAVMISEYRRLVASKNLNLSIKPVVMFKTVKNTANIDALFDKFVNLIDTLDIKEIDAIFKKSSLEVLKKLEKLVENKQDFINGLKYSFSKSKCLVIHSKVKDKEEKLKYLNSLEDINNPIRTIFAVNILNEGWDVLNLFDIVKLDEAKKTLKSTISEAQLIGRGARYFPFVYEDADKYKRKFDELPNEDMKILEELYFHSINQSDYIEAIRNELRKIGLLDDADDEYKTVELRVKQSFLDDDLYINGFIYTNIPIEQDKTDIKSISDYIKDYKSHKRCIDNQSHELVVYDEDIQSVDFKEDDKFTIKKKDANLVRVAINKKPFFYFSNLKKYFPNLKSISEFIASPSYLCDIEITFHSSKTFELTDEVKIKYILEILDFLEKEIVRNFTTKVGSFEFYPKKISSKIPEVKILKLKDSDSPIHHKDASWYVFEPHNGTSEEKHFVEFIKSNIDELYEAYEDVKLIRNEKAFDIFSFDKKRDGAKFEPDFILLLKDKEGCYHQIFCEPKGDWTKDKVDGFENSSEKWKNDFLADITKCTESKCLQLKDINGDGLELYENKCYKILGLPFYNYAMQKEFKEKFKGLIL